MYVYEHPDGTTTYHTVDQASPAPVEYAPADEYYYDSPNGGGSPEHQMMRSPSAQPPPTGRGYNLLADVGDGLRPASRGGRLFAKQQERMPRYTSESQAAMTAPQRTAPPTPAPRRCVTAQGNGVSLPPWGGPGGKKPQVKWGIPQHLQQNGNGAAQNGANNIYDEVTGYRGNALAPLPQPLPEWRAKTETNYKFGDPPIRPFSAVGFGNTHSGWGDKNSYYPFTLGSKIGIPIATVSFDARLYQVNPHRKQVAQDAYTPELFIMRDFNAKPLGWTREFVDQYYHGRI